MKVPSSQCFFLETLIIEKKIRTMECQVATKIHGETRKSNTETRQRRHFIVKNFLQNLTKIIILSHRL